MSARDEAAGGVGLLPCPECGQPYQSPGVAKAMKVFRDGLAKRRARERGLPWRVAPWGDGTSKTGHSNIFSDAWQVTIASEILTETAEFIVAAANALGEVPTPKFAKTYCSQCGGEFGPGDSGYSHCVDHEFDEQPLSPAASSPRDQACSAMMGSAAGAAPNLPAAEKRPATPYEFSKDWCLKSAEIEGNAEIGAGSLAALSAAHGMTEVNLAELFALMDEADGALDKDTYKQRLQDNFDAPDDAEYCVLMGTIRKCDALFRAIEKMRSSRATAARSAGIEPGEGG